MKHKKTFLVIGLILFQSVSMSLSIRAREFVHPGGLHTLEDLNRMKAKVAAKESPWLESWNLLVSDNKSQSSWGAAPSTNLNNDGTRQRASLDAHAAYYNTLRWYISGDTKHAECAVRILNAWSSTVKTCNGELFQLPINNLMQAAELLRIYPGWKEKDQEQFKNVALTVFYPACRNFLGNCGRPASWDSPALSSMMIIAVFCDDEAKYDEAVKYYKEGSGNGSLLHAICQPTGQIAEMGRDQTHATIGPAFLAEMAQTAYNQGDESLYDYAENRLLAGFEYYCKFNLNHPDVPWVPWNNCLNENLFYIAGASDPNRIRQSPVYEMVYNHYAIRKGLETPWVKAMADLARPEGLGDSDFFGCGTLAYTLDAEASPYRPHAIPSAPTELTATSGASFIQLEWKAPEGDVSQGYNVFRSTQSGGPYTKIAGWDNNTSSSHTDWNVEDGKTYYYTVSANNQSGTGNQSIEMSATASEATPVMPTGWVTKDIGTVSGTGEAHYVNNVFVVTGKGGNGLESQNDANRFVYTTVTGDVTITARLFNTTTFTKQGLMMRESINPNAKAICFTMGPHDPRYVEAIVRDATSGWPSAHYGNLFSKVPLWIKIQRTGNTFTVLQSGDNKSWYKVYSLNISMGESICVGMFVGNGTAMFDNVSVENESDVPVSPTEFAAEAFNSSRIKLSWSVSANASGYILKRSVTPDSGYTTIASGITGTGYEDTDLEANAIYYYSLKSVNIKGESTDSSLINAKTLELSIPPAPTNLSSKAGNLQVGLTWDKVEEFTTSYVIKRSKEKGGSYTIIGTVSVPEYTDKTVENDTLYYYVVSAINSLGESENSKEITAKPLLGEFAYFPFNEISGTSSNDSWSSRKATLTGTTWTEGKFNNGIYLDGTNTSYIALPAGIVNTLRSFTISLWVNAASVTSWIRIFDFGSGDANYMFLTPRSGNGQVRFAIKKGGGEQIINGTTSLQANKWAHVAVTLEWDDVTEKGIGKLYVNGSLVGTNSNMTINPSMLPSTTANYLGKSQFSADPYLKGTIDEFRIYTQPLTLEQIKRIYNMAAQTITFGPIPEKKLDDPDFEIEASTSSGLNLHYETSNSRIAKIVDGTVQILSFGQTNITVSQSGNLDFSSALSVVQPLVISDLSGIELIGNSNYVVYSDPSSDFLNIKLQESFTGTSMLRIYDASGKWVYLEECEGKEIKLDIRGLNNGIYFIQVVNGQLSMVSKFIKKANQ